ncbi:putative mitochondrial hypothetical protein [Leptomonas pyrrhocoris]|uniref:Uncharacterized protein n=1 Tax=Leptomonas pyrrhocoris TaxID=157538 RepID=A0A0M9FWV5_LEPPY|nr:putative mitochondrial hypothetical protein [Leptomonas pyrrhocoris]XP_015656037.1 putative mitochondrial hypothetical protein [Leptomonas pyrrhocoris]KPA77597.1 putative mitochondrial hypothetical protein [Leptomonas pyrrhocoris]KPA77598.1 putative mitochondrial hypothetical protein [Leptomonas pyrrhocoris]|eukprot:XP_015656036.1 putative mitochondrial hypothetical protein [Leptomonas pyrrhocoris]
MNSYVKRYTGSDVTVQEMVGFKRARDKRLVICSALTALGIYVAIYWSEERERTRRHTSIEKDIERERWRARELGLGKPTDDGFVERYEASNGKIRA